MLMFSPDKVQVTLAPAAKDRFQDSSRPVGVFLFPFLWNRTKPCGKHFSPSEFMLKVLQQSTWSKEMLFPEKLPMKQNLCDIET